MTTPFWMQTFARGDEAEAVAMRAEATGWDGVLFNDTQNILGDPYACLGIAAAATERITLGTAVTNPATRHPSVTASAIATVDLASGGRAMLGLGRGDSSLGHIGRRPVQVPELERYLDRLQRYLEGRTVDLDGFDSRNQWIAETGLPKLPVFVAASGPKVMEAAARHADGVILSLGADPGRVDWGARTVREACERVGRDPDAFRVFAVVTIVVQDDLDTARALARGGIASMARFASLPGASLEGLDERARDVIRRISEGYDLRAHSEAGSGHARGLEADFIDLFGIAGPPQRCIDRVGSLLAAGLDGMVVYGASRDTAFAVRQEVSSRFATEVIPAVRRVR